jgi:hypothetical protein
MSDEDESIDLRVDTSGKLVGVRELEARMSDLETWCYRQMERISALPMRTKEEEEAVSMPREFWGPEIHLLAAHMEATTRPYEEKPDA